MPEHGATLARRTRDAYASVYAVHIAPWLDDEPIRELTVSRLRAWQAQRVAAGVGTETIQKARTFLSSVLRHAAESKAIPANSLALVRAPRAQHTDEVVPRAPSTIEQIRAVVAAPMPAAVAEGTRWRDPAPRVRDGRPDKRDPTTRQRDAALVATLAYSGLRPGEAAALRWSDVRDRTILAQRATEPDGAIKSTKGRKSRSVRLLSPPMDEGGLGQLAPADMANRVLPCRPAGHAAPI